MSEEKIPVGIIGLGMVGEPLRRWFEEVRGHKRGKTLFLYDADLQKGYFDDINRADVIFVCAPTPSNPDGSCNTKIVASAVETIKDGKIIVIKSTVTPGTTQLLQEKNLNKFMIFNGEYLTESQSWSDFLHPARQIIGFTFQSKKYSTLVLNLLPQANFQSPTHMDYWKFEMTATEAEVVKYASNVFGFLKVIFGNMFSDYCEAVEKKLGVGVSYENVRKAVAADQRINEAWLGPVNHGGYRGAGGFCFPKDMNAHIQTLKSHVINLESSPLKTLLGKQIKIFENVWDYNAELLKQQGKTLVDVSKHEKEIVV